MTGVDPNRGVYGISVAADLVGMDPQSLRLYERRGLLEPARTAGGTRRYSSEDIRRLERIGQLLEDGLNLAGIALVLRLEADNARLRALMGTQAPRRPRTRTGRRRPTGRSADGRPPPATPRSIRAPAPG